jgi:tetratricopeptide (TPR) repeat protein
MRYFLLTALLIVFVIFFVGYRDYKVGVFYSDLSKALEAAKQEHYEDADKFFNELTLKYPDKYLVFYDWGTTLINWGNCGGKDALVHFQKACVQFEKAANLNPDFDQIFYNWGNTYARMTPLDSENIIYYSQACEKFQKATQINPNHASAFSGWGIMLLNWGQIQGDDAHEKYMAACNKFQIATTIKPDLYGAFNSWGDTLICLAQTEKDSNVSAVNYSAACEKFQKATEISPESYKAFNSWGVALTSLAKINNDKKTSLLKQAESVFLKSDTIKKGYSAYNLACVYALLDEEEKGRQWLKVGKEAKTLPPREYAMKDPDFASMRDKDWFKAIRWKGE